MARKKKHAEHVNHERWLVSYADFITLLFAFFVVMFSVSQVDSKKVGRFTESFRDALEWQPVGLNNRSGGKGVLSNLVSAIPPPGGMRQAPTRDGFGDEAAQIRAGLLRRSETAVALAGLIVLEVKGELVLRLPERLMFTRGDAVLDPDGKAALAAIAEELRDRPIRLRVEGHTDDSPIHNSRYPSNWELSMARAMAVVAVFLEDGNLDPSRLAAAGYAEYHPIAENTSPEGRAANRRVDLIIVADLEQRALPPSLRTPKRLEPEDQTEDGAPEAPSEPSPPAKEGKKH